MTMEEKIEMYKEKKRFIERLSEAFRAGTKGSSVEEITYEVYTKQFNDRLSETREYVIVHFFGGGKSPKFVSGNSNVANFRVLGTMIDGGYYDEVREYEGLKEHGYERLSL
jgi:hypothetical protein